VLSLLIPFPSLQAIKSPDKLREPKADQSAGRKPWLSQPEPVIGQGLHLFGVNETG